MPRSHSTSVSLTEEDKEELDRRMAEYGIHNRSEMIRRLLWESVGKRNPNQKPSTAAGVGAADPGINGTPTAVHVVEKIATVAGVQAPAGADYPRMDAAGHNLALVVSRNHMGEIAAGTLPVVGDDALAAGLDPHGRRAWEIYTETLPGFFQVLLGLDRPPKPDVRYEPLDSVDGQYAGAVSGEVVSCGQIYPDGNTIKYVKMEVRTAAQTVPVLVPATEVREIVEDGMMVYAAGVFAVSRQKVVLRASKCAGVRIDGYGPIYDLMDEWGLSNADATKVIRTLEAHCGQAAPDYVNMFVAYARMDRDGNWSLTLDGPGGEKVRLDWSDLRRAKPGKDAVLQCTGRWPRVARLAGAAGVIPD